MKTIKIDGVEYTEEQLDNLIDENGYSRQWEDDTVELGVCEMINPENNQYVITAICEKVEIAYNEAIVATTATDQYHNWTAEFAPELTIIKYEDEDNSEEQFKINLEAELSEYEINARKNYPAIIGIDRNSVKIEETEEKYKVIFKFEIEFPY